MQEFTLKRQIISNKAILGTLFKQDAEICKTLENPWLNNHPNISCIPNGRYIVKKYSSTKYPDVWELQAVEGRSKILIHQGNIEKHTQGCILVGDKFGFLKDQPAVLNSRTALDKLRSIFPKEFVLNIISD